MKSSNGRFVKSKPFYLSLFAMLICISATTSAQIGDPEEKADVAPKLQKRASEYNKPVIIKFDGAIDFNTTAYFKRRVASAKSYGADLLIVQVDSPGGYAMLSFEIGEILRDIDWAYTVAYVPREAISGAALFSLGCDEIVLGDQARIGDAGPIEYDPSLAAYRDVPAKAKSMLARQARDLAKSKLRSPELAEAMVDEKAVVFYQEAPKRDGNADNGPENKDAASVKKQLIFKTVYLKSDDQNPIEAAKSVDLDLSKWTLVEETGTERYFTVNGPRAVELGFVSFTANDRESLLKEFNSSTDVREYKYQFSDGMAFWLSTPLLTGLLILIGLLALYLELSAPGIGAGGMIAALCATLFFWSRFLSGTSGWLEVILFMAGITFLVMEVFVIPGFGIAGFLGMLMLFVSVVMASQDFIVPATGRQWNQLLTTLTVVLVSSCLFIIGAAVISKKLKSIPVLSSLSLKPPVEELIGTVDKATGKPLPSTHPDVSLGDWGTADSLLRPAGRALFNDRSIDVVSDGSYIEPGTQIRVVEISGNRIVVSQVENTDETVWKKSSES